MLIRFVFGPRAGETAHAERSQATQLLIDAGVIEAVEDDSPVQPRPRLTDPRLGPHVESFAEPRWGVTTLASGYPAIQLNVRTETYYFDGRPEHADKLRGLPVPAEVIAEYKRQLGGKKPRSEAV